MRRNSKALGLALVAVFAMSALVASAAQAQQSYRSSASPTTLSGSQVTKNVFHVPGAGTVECSTATFAGTQTGTAVSDVTITPTYSGCVAFGFSSTHINMNGCQYTFTTPSNFKATSDVICPGSNKIQITPTFFGSSVCTVQVGAQTPSGVVDLENKESESHVLVTATVTGIAHSAGCGASAASDGEYTGSVTEKGGANKVWVT